MRRLWRHFRANDQSRLGVGFEDAGHMGEHLLRGHVRVARGVGLTIDQERDILRSRGTANHDGRAGAISM